MPFAPTAHRRRRARSAALAGLLLAALPGAAAAQGDTVLTTVRVASGILQPVWAGSPRGDFGRLFVVQQGINGVGQIRVIDLRTRTLQTTPYLTISGMHTDGEAGLLSMVFHPDFAANGYFWIYGNFGTEVRLVRYRALGDPLTSTAAEPASAQIVLRIPGHPDIHNSGWMEFGPDGHLYLTVGDGGFFTSHHAQILTNNLSGKLLRLDVDGTDGIPGNADDDAFPADPDRHYAVPADNPFVGLEGDDEIWAYGLRNAWRGDIDPVTGDLYLGDVGHGTWEEISFQPANIPGTLPGQPGYQGGRNYGWPCYEGPDEGSTPGLCPDPSALTFPIIAYGHNAASPPIDMTGCAVTGGVVYRGCAMPELQGAYFFADFCRAWFFSLRYDGGAITELADRTAELDPGGGLDLIYPVSFGRDAWGEVYVCDLVGGEVFKIVPAAPHDVNGDNIADACRCPADWNSSGATDSTDISAFLSSWLAALTNPAAPADYNADGVTNSSDIAAFLSSWLSALAGGC